MEEGYGRTYPPPPLPVAVSSAAPTDMATMVVVVDTVDTLYRATGGGMGMGCAAYGAARVGVGVGAGLSSVLEDQLLGTYRGTAAQNSSAHPAPYGGGYDGGGGGYDDLPLGLWRIWRL
jgi:hypothetical protein